MKKQLFSLISITLFLLIAFNQAFAKDTITIAVHDYAPYYNSEGKGVLIDMYKAACGVAGLEAEFKVLPIKRGIGYLFQNKVDAFSPGHIFLSPGFVKMVCTI